MSPTGPHHRGIAALVATVLLGAATPAGAHWSASRGGSLLVERYLVCDGDVDARCVGPVVAKPALLRALEPGPILADRNNDRVVEPAHQAALFAAYFDMQEAVVPLRALLRQPLPRGAADTHTEIEVNALRAEAAYALAELGDRASAPEITKLLLVFETEGHGSLWADTLTALTRLSPPDASAYARDFLGRIELADLRTSMPGGSSQLEALAPILAAGDRAALPVLRRLTAGEDATDRGAAKLPLVDVHHWCRLMGARLALGEQPLTDRVREAFAGSYSGTMVASCDNQFLRAYGSDPRDAEILLRHTGRDDLGFDAGMSLVAYDRIIALVAALGDRGDRAAVRARAKLRAGLRARSGYPHVADPSSRNYGTHFVALHDAALAGLGDADALQRLRGMIVDADDRSGVADLAALRAVQLGLPGALDDAGTRLALDVAFENDERSGIFADVRERLLQAIIARAPGDARWAIALVDAERDVREQAMAAYARLAPAGACEAVIAAAGAASGRGIDDGFLVLTAVGDGCAAPLQRLARDVDAPAKTRGMAFEALAVLGVTLPRALVEAARAQPDMDVHLDRAAAVTAARKLAR